MIDLPKYFDDLISLLETYIADKTDHFTLQTESEKWEVAPYVQALQEHGNVLLIESASNKYLMPKLPVVGQQAMIFLGWRFYPERYLPNYAQFIDQSKVSPREIALKMVRALHFAYGVDHTYTFEISPQIDAAKSISEKLGISIG